MIREPDWRLAVGGLVQQPLALTLAELRARPRQEVIFTLECSGNHGFPFFTGGIGTAHWAGTPLAPLLREAGPLPQGTEVVFWGADAGPGPVGDQTVTEQFARSMSLADALDPNILLCYEMNGAPLHPAHGFPVRLIAPGWYGVANVKWLARIEVLNTRYEGRFMARDYVTQRTVQQDGQDVDAVHLGRAGAAQVGPGAGGARSPVSGRGGGLGRTDRAGRGADRRRAVAAGDDRRRGCREADSRGGAGAWTGAADRRGAHRHLAGLRHEWACPAGPGRPSDREQADLLGEQRPDHPPRAHPLAGRSSARCRLKRGHCPS